ncbi:MAG: DUF2953 domain-containing protein [Muricomes sp.]
MLHIILLILKIIGWILLAILGIIVLLVCVVLFVPLRYKGEAACGGSLDSLRGERGFPGFHIWSAGMLSMTRESWTGKFGLYGKKWGSDVEEPPPRKKAKEIEEKKEISAQEDVRALPGGEEKPSEDEKVPEAEEKEKEKKTEEKTENKEKTLQETSVKRIEKPDESAKPKKGLFSKIRELYEKIVEKIRAVYEKIKYTILKICDTIKTLLKRIDELMELITDEVHQSALIKTLEEVKRLLIFLKPKKLKVFAHFGFEDPSVTGYVLAVISMIYPFAGKHMDIHPDFEQEILEGEVFISGKVRVLHFIIPLWNLIWNKNVRITFRHVRNFNKKPISN